MEHGFQYQRDLQIVSIHNRPSLDSTIRNSHQPCLGATPGTILRTSALATLDNTPPPTQKVLPYSIYSYHIELIATVE